MARRRRFTDHFKAKVALEALHGDKTIQEIAAKHQVHPNQVSTWKRQAVEGMADVFVKGGKSPGARRKSKNCMPRSGGWQLRTIFCLKGSSDEPRQKESHGPA